VQITFLGHACFELEAGGTRVLIDPYLTDNPNAARSADEVDPSHILLTHGHVDHYGDVIAIAERTGAAVVAVEELAQEVRAQLGDAHEVFQPNLGGTVVFDWGWVKLVQAWHTSTTPSGIVNTPVGLIVNLGGKTVFHLGDTALFSDLQLIARRAGPIDVALVPIGGYYTMDRHDAVIAAELVNAEQVIPCHYDTFASIRADVHAFKADAERATTSQVVVLAPGESHVP
jgi:L-ascorbate metabolism protein UlaG (beta-lactamase superfamily)